MLFMDMLEVMTSNPLASVVSEVLIVLELSGPGDQVMRGRDEPLAVQLSSAVSPSSNSTFTLVLGFVIKAVPEIRKNEVGKIIHM